MKRSRLTSITLGLVWLASLAAVFLLGLMAGFAFHLQPMAASAEQLTPVEQEAAAVAEQLLGEALDWARLNSYSPRDRIPPQVEQILPALAGLSGPMERRTVSARFFRVLPQNKTGALATDLVDAGDYDEDVLWGLLHAWAGHDPETARSFFAAALAADRVDPELASAVGHP